MAISIDDPLGAVNGRVTVSILLFSIPPYTLPNFWENTDFCTARLSRRAYKELVEELP